MRLLIISNMAHYDRDGQIVGHGATVREINHLAQLFDTVRHVGCLHSEDAPLSALPYDAENITLVPIPPSGGNTLYAKLQGIWFIPLYSWVILRELCRADVVHVRAPANIPLLALFWLALLPFPRLRWLKYAGSWEITPLTSRLSRIQRWWLGQNLSRGIVTINGIWPKQPSHIRSFVNPCLTDQELAEGRYVARSKKLAQPIRLILVGRVEMAKGIGRALQIVHRLQERDIDYVFDIIGDGPERSYFEKMANEIGVITRVHFRGELPREALSTYYACAHIILLPTDSEGWPKVLSEAMAYGVVPIASAVGSIPYYLTRFHVGHSVPKNDIDQYVDAIVTYVQNPTRWKTEASRASDEAFLFSYDHYLSQVCDILQLKTDLKVGLS